jgi:Domain of unknown function (DUF4917)
MQGDLPDGTLHTWPEIADRHPWETLLLGNGLSINIWPGFGYDRLYEHAEQSVLSDEDRALFQSTPNFELVLSDLLTAIRVNEVVGVQTDPLYSRYRAIQRALGTAVRDVHVNRDAVPGVTRAAVRAALEQCEWIFTTSYDLLLYWSIAYGGHFRPFKDHFRWGGRCEFDPDRADVLRGEIPIYFLHGALHLVVGGDGVTWKLRRTLIRTLLEQFGEPIFGDDRARPLLVTEGSARDKLRAIEANAYLTHALGRLESNPLPLIVFGSGLSEQDQHIADAISASPDRPVAVSMLPATRPELLAAQLEVHGRIAASELLFFDAKTHPLGDPRLRVAL